MPLVAMDAMRQPFLRDEGASYNDLVYADGSVDVHFGSVAPAGMEANWICTAPAKRWITLFRFCGPEKPVFAKTWRLPDIEEVK